MPVAGVRVDRADELIAAIRTLERREANRALRSAHREIAKRVEGESRGRGTRQQQAAARAILGRGNVTNAQITIRNLASLPFGVVAFAGSPRRTGWAARARRGRPQHPRWIGRHWDIDAGTGPMVVTDVIASNRNNFIDWFVDALDNAARAAGLDVQ